MSTLYRDYRPQDFSGVLGQNHIKITLQNEIAASKPASAYLFCGPRAVGKTTLARILAKAVNCDRKKEGEFEPCNECASCLSIKAGKSLDVVEIDAASNTGVDNVRENIIAFSRLAPSSSKYKVFIIDEVHMLSISAFNALLKIIEEPPAYVIFILCTTEIQKVPSTVVSRCERFDFKRISVNEIVKKLSYIAIQEKIEIDNDVLEAVARRSGGHLRDAESLLGQIFALGEKKVTGEAAELVIPHYNSNEAVSLLEFLSKKDAAKAIALINALVDSGLNTKVFLNEIITLLRKVMISKLSPELINKLGLDLSDNLEKRLAEISAILSWEQIFRFTRRFLEAASDSRSSLIPQLSIELAVLELCFMQTVGPSANTQANAGRGNTPETPPHTFKSKKEDQKNIQAEDHTALKAELNMAPDEILAKWPEFLIKIKKYNHSLSFVLQNCEPREVKDGKLCLVFKYKFHQDRINDPNIKSIVETTLAEVFGSGLTYSSQIDENLEIKREENEKSVQPANQQEKAVKEEKPASGLMSDLLKTFGGEIIN